MSTGTCGNPVSSARPCDGGTIVIGIGNPLRQDDRAGIEIVERLGRSFKGGLKTLVVYEPDICLAETISAYSRLIIVDAFDSSSGEPFSTVTIGPSDGFCPERGVSSHCFSWGMLLAMARDIYGHFPETTVLRVTASEFGISESISPACEANVREALSYLTGLLSEAGA